jgi:hypothetical protein
MLRCSFVDPVSGKAASFTDCGAALQLTRGAARAEGVDRVRSIGITGAGVHAEPRAVDDQARSLPIAGSFDGSAIGDVARAAPRAAT